MKKQLFGDIGSCTPIPKYQWDTYANCVHSARVIMDEYGLNWNDKAIISSCLQQESGFNPRAIGKPNYNGTVDYGIAQFNNGKINGKPLWIGPGATFKSVDEVLTNPEKCVRVMVQCYKQGQIKLWSSYSMGDYKKFMPRFLAHPVKI